MKNRKLFQTCIAGMLSAAMLMTSVSVWGAEFGDGAAVQDAVVIAEEPTEATAEEEVPEIELFSADDAKAADVAVNKTNFPDAKFRAYVTEKFDTNKSGGLSTAEIQAAKEIDITGLGVANLKGVERFTYATSLFASRNKLKAADLTKNTKLQNINLSQNALTGTLDLSKCTAMKIIKYSNNSLTKVTMPAYKYLKKVDYIDASYNKFTTQANAGLKYIDNAYMTVLSEVNASNNQIATFDCSGFQGFLDLTNNKITTLTGGKNGYQATGLYLAGKNNTLSKTKVVDFSVLGNRIPQRITYNSAAKSKFKMMTPKLTTKTTWDKITLTVNCSAPDARYVLQKKPYGGAYKNIATWAAGELEDPEFGENQYVDTDVSVGGKYVYRLLTYVKVQNADKKDVEWSASTGGTIYAAPPTTTMSVKSSKKAYATITWKKVEGADGYEVYYGTTSSATKGLTRTTTALTATKKVSNSGKKLYFKVRAYKLVNKKRVYAPFCSAKSVKIK